MNTYLKAFVGGGFYFLGLSQNPLREYLQKSLATSDADKIHSDWKNVGNSIQKSYEYETHKTTI